MEDKSPPCWECRKFVPETNICKQINLKVDKRDQNVGPCYNFEQIEKKVVADNCEEDYHPF